MTKLLPLILVMALSFFPSRAWAGKGDFDFDVPLGIVTLMHEDGAALGYSFGLEGRLSLSDKLITRLALGGQTFNDVGGENGNAFQGSFGALWVFPKADFFMEPYVSLDFGATHLFGQAFSETRATVLLGGGATYYTRRNWFHGPRLQYGVLLGGEKSELILNWMVGYRF